MKEKFKVEIGQKYGAVTILKKLPNEKNGSTIFLAKCECGNEKIIYKSNLERYRNSKCTCGRKYKGGFSSKPLYGVWYKMIKRCNDKTEKGYEWYGAKGISVCEEWQNKYGYVNFYKWSIENGYKEEKMPSGKNRLTIDRIDPTKGYSPDNCRWVDYTTQVTNIRKLCTNKSGYIGVAWSKQEKKWICVISINNRSKRIGAYNTQKEAVEARNKFIDDNNLPHQKNEYKGELSHGY